MFLHLGQSTVVTYDEIIGIFDLDTASVQKATRDTLARAEREGRVINVSSYDLPKSFVICREPRAKKAPGAKQAGEGPAKNECRVYISPISSSTLLKRIGHRISQSS